MIVSIVLLGDLCLKTFVLLYVEDSCFLLAVSVKN